jgi:predicted transcriptional regulator
MVSNSSRMTRPKRKSDEVKIEILRALDDGKVYTYSSLSKKLGTGYATTITNGDFLRILGFVTVETIPDGETASGKNRSTIRITKKGRAWLAEVNLQRTGDTR